MAQCTCKGRLPGWLWFLVAIPLGVLAALLYYQKRLPQQRQQLERLKHLAQMRAPARRYVEPDSIPLDASAAEILMSEITPGAPEAELPLAPILPAADAAPAARAAAIPGTDDLKVIEGIGPVISRLLFENGIATYAALASTRVERLDEILTEAKLRRLADPSTWPEQAALAATGNWEALAQLQQTLTGGRRKIQRG